MVAAVLHLHEHPRQAFLQIPPADAAPSRVTAMMSADRDLLAGVDAEGRRARECRARVVPGLAAHLVVIADHAIDLGHAGEHLGLGLRRAAGDDDPRSPAARA